jgi:2,4-dienoyl-CoA reductase-like NADH-dependent reductase (Old Yellow Enzyme family)
MGIEFLRPLNQRPGKFGGSFENRASFFLDLYDYASGQMKARGMEDFLLGSRVSVYEAIQGGFGTSGPGEVIEDLSEPCKFAECMHDHGANYINITAGIPARMPELTRPSKSAPFGIYNHFRLTKVVKDHLVGTKKNMIVIGSAYSMLKEGMPRYAAGNVQSGATDLVGLGRQILADPSYPKKFLSNKKENIKYCIGCNLCAKLLGKQRYVGCANYYDKFKKNLKN